MTVTVRTIVDQIEVVRTGHVQVRLATLIEQDGVEIAKQYHRYSAQPGADLATIQAAVDNDLTANLKRPATEAEGVSRVAAVAGAVWTQKVLDDWQALKDAQIIGT